MQVQLDLSKEYGLVLEGGGAKGAYQIGVWEALKEAQVKVKAIAGTSVGALNGALICMDDLEGAKAIWKDICYSQIMDVDDEKMKKLFEGGLSLVDTITAGLAHIVAGGVDVTPLKNLIAQYVDEDKVRNSDISFYLHTFCVDEMRDLDIDVRDIPKGQIKDFLLASAYIFPLFKNEKLYGRMYIDGGAINNVPVDSLIKREVKDIIVIRIFGIGREKKVQVDDSINLYTIEPRVNLGNIIDFDCKKSKRNMVIGYYDAKRFLYGLKGNIYYIEENAERCYYLLQLVSSSNEVKQYIMNAYGMHKDEKEYERCLFEKILPSIASELKLEKDWNYESLFLGMLEATAKLLKVKKYTIYKVQELLSLVRERYSRKTKGIVLPSFSALILDHPL